MLKKFLKYFKSPQKQSAYGMSKEIKNFLNYPSFLPLPCRYEHAPYVRKNCSPEDLRLCKNLMLVHNSLRKKLWKNESQIPAMIIGSPFVHYRKTNKIKIDKKAKGTIVFPTHAVTSDKFSIAYDCEKYCEDLKNLPAEFHPISICLHYTSLEQGIDEIYKKHGFKVLCAGLSEDNDFIKNTYTILKNFKYSCSNTITSAGFYAIEMGIPFFLYGDDATVSNQVVTTNLPLGEYDLLSLFDKEDIEPFQIEPKTEVTEKQKKYVAKILGINEKINPKKIRNTLLQILFKNHPLFFIGDISSNLFGLIKNPVKYLKKRLRDKQQKERIKKLRILK